MSTTPFARVVTPCPYEPISVDDAMLHCRVDSEVERDYIAALVSAAREYVEGESWRTLMPCVRELVADKWQTRFVLPHPPLRSVQSVKWLDAAGVEQTVPGTDYYVDALTEPGTLTMLRTPAGTLAASSGVRVRYVAGVADELTTSSTEQINTARAAVSERHKAAIKLLVAHLYENREEVSSGAGVSAIRVPMGITALLMPDRAFRF